MENYYEKLGISNDASIKEILTASTKMLANAKTEEERDTILEITTILTNPKQREDYDETLDNLNSNEPLQIDTENEIDEISEENKKLKIRLNRTRIAAWILGGVVLVGGITALVKNHSKDDEALPVEPTETIEETEKIDIEKENNLIDREPLTATNFSAKVDEIMKNNEEKGLTTTRDIVETALLLTNLEDFSDEDLNTLMDVENVNMQDKVNELLNYVICVEEFNLNNYQDLSKHVSLADLSYNQFDYNVLTELDTTYLDLMDVLQLDIVKNADELNAKYEKIREKLDIKDDNEEDLVIVPTENAYVTKTLTYIEKFIVGDGNLTLADGKEYAKQNINNNGTGILIESYVQVIGDMINAKEEYMLPEYQNLINTINSNTNGLSYINGIYGYTLPTPACQKTLTK